MRSKYIAYFSLIALEVLFVGCGGSSDSYSDFTSDFNNTPSTTRILYASSSFDRLCQDSKSFNLYPSKRDIKAQIMNFYPTVYNVTDAEAIVNVKQMTDPQNSTELSYDETNRGFFAQCVPISYHDKTKIYQPFEVDANITGSDDSYKRNIVLYQSDETNCMFCHKSNAFENAKPTNGWADSFDDEVDFKTNILRLHDQKYLEKTSQYIKANLPSYSPLGLEESAKNTLVLCSDCHHVMGIEASGSSNLPPLTSSFHATHMNLKDPYMANMQNCVTCHPGDKITPVFENNIMHKRGDEWVKVHGDILKQVDQKQCTLCHGYDYRGSSLSKTLTEYKYKQITYNKGDIVSCFDCHSDNKWGLKAGF